MKKSIFYNNKKTSEVITEGIIFALGTVTALTVISALIIAIINI